MGKETKMVTCEVDEAKVAEAMEDLGLSSVQEFLDLALKEAVARVAQRKTAFTAAKAPDILDAFEDFHKLDP